MGCRQLTAPVDTVMWTEMGLLLFWEVAAWQSASTKAVSSTYTCRILMSGQKDTTGRRKEVWVSHACHKHKRLFVSNP